jgi:hypothetical protein
MTTNLQIVCDAYDSTWLDIPFTNVINVDEWLMASPDIAGFPDHRIGQNTTHLSETVKTHFHLSEEGATCGPFAIIAAEKLNRDEWDIDYLHTGHHGATVVQKFTQPYITYLIDSSLQAVYKLPSTGYLWSSGNHIFH